MELIIINDTKLKNFNHKYIFNYISKFMWKQHKDRIFNLLV